MFAEILIKINNHPTNYRSLGGVKQLLQRASQLLVLCVTQKSVQEYQLSEQTYTLHKPARRRFTRNNIYVAGIDAQLQIDLADMQGISKQNGRMTYFFPWFMYFPSLPAQSQTTPTTPRQSQRRSSWYFQPQTHATLSDYSDNGKKFFNSDF